MDFQTGSATDSAGPDIPRAVDIKAGIGQPKPDPKKRGPKGPHESKKPVPEEKPVEVSRAEVMAFRPLVSLYFNLQASRRHDEDMLLSREEETAMSESCAQLVKMLLGIESKWTPAIALAITATTAVAGRELLWREKQKARKKDAGGTSSSSSENGAAVNPSSPRESY